MLCGARCDGSTIFIIIVIVIIIINTTTTTTTSSLSPPLIHSIGLWIRRLHLRHGPSSRDAPVWRLCELRRSALLELSGRARGARRGKPRRRRRKRVELMSWVQVDVSFFFLPSFLALLSSLARSLYRHRHLWFLVIASCSVRIESSGIDVCSILSTIHRRTPPSRLRSPAKSTGACCTLNRRRGGQGPPPRGYVRERASDRLCQAGRQAGRQAAHEWMDS